ncbi:MAG: hypothetical protein Fues2KO_47080 [Fuerstiella sp.]
MDMPGVTTLTTADATPTASVGDSVYDSLNPKGRRRRASRVSINPEERLMTQQRRDDINANANDVHRNVAMLQWMIRQTLNYCCTFDVQFQTNDDGLNHALRDLMERDCRAENLDYVGRMDWDDHRRVLESLKLTGGDSFVIPLRERRIQALEGVVCRNPRSFDAGDRWCKGARLNRRNRVVAWNFRDESLIRTEPNAPDKTVSARNVWQHVQYEGRLNQIRGISPINAILNELRDVYEGFDHARAKMKLDQIFGAHVKYKDGGGDPDDPPAPTVNSSGGEPDDDATTEDDLHMDFGNGPVVVDREDIEDVKLLLGNNPSSNTQEFLKLCIMVALIALDLPFNFFDAAHTNFFGSRSAWILYERSCMARRKTQIRLHNRMTNWRLFQWFLPTDFGGTGELTLPRSMRIEDVRYRWIPRGVPWWKPKEEIEANLAAVALGWKTNQGVCDENGFGLYAENLKQLARERDEAEKHGFVLSLNPAKLGASLQPSRNPEGRS